MVLLLLVMAVFGSGAAAQDVLQKKDTVKHLSPMLIASFKKPATPARNINDRYKMPNKQLMYWPNYPLTAAQIMARDAKYDRPLGKQIASDIAESYVNYLLYGRNKKPVASVPKF